MKKIFYKTGILNAVLIIFYTIMLSGQVLSQQQAGIRVIVGKFSSNETAGKRLEKDVPFLLNRSLLGFKGLVMVEDERFGNITIAAKDYSQKKDIMDDYQGLDYILFGDIASLKEGFVINAFLLDVKNNLIYDQKPVMGNNSTLLDICSEISKGVSGKIYELNRSLTDQKITLALITNTEMTMNKKGSETDYLTDLIIRKAIKSLEYSENNQVLPYDECVKFYGLPENDVAKYLKANGIFHLKMVERNDYVKVLIPTFYVKKDKNAQAFDKKIDMPDIPSDYYNKFNFNDFVLNELLSFVNAVVTKEGTWRLEEFLFTSNDPGAYIMEGRKYQGESQLFLSNYYYYKALELTKDLIVRNSIYYELGKNKIAEYRLDEASEEFNKILVNDPENLEGIKGLGIVSLEKQDYNEAFKKFYFVSAQDPGDKEINMLLGTVQFELGQYEDALKTFKKARTVDPGNSLSSHYIGLCYIQLHLYDNSILEFKNLFEQYPGNEDYRYYLSYSLAEKGISEYYNKNFSAAVEFLRQSNQILPLNYTSNVLRLSLIRLGLYEDAASLIEEEILNKNYDRTDIYYRHALDVRDVFLDNQYDPVAGMEVIRNLKLSLKYYDNPQAYHYIGNTYIYMGNIDMGLTYLSEAHDKDPSNTSINLDLMESMLMNNRFRECIEFFEQLSSEKRNYEVTDRYLALMDYLMISAVRLNGQDTRSYERDLNRILERDVIIDGWSYVPYKTWLNEGDFAEADKAFLLELTAKMEKRNKTSQE